MFALAPAPARPRVDDALADLSAALREAARTDAADAICTALRAADALTALAVDLLGRGGFSASIGMDPVTLLQLDARRTFSDARMLATTGGVLTTMPLTAAAFAGGSLSYAEVRGIVLAVKVCDAAGRAQIDALVGSLVGTSVSGDDLLTRVDDEVCRLRADLQLVREDRAIDRGWSSPGLTESCYWIPVLPEQGAQDGKTRLSTGVPTQGPRSDRRRSQGRRHRA